MNTTKKEPKKIMNIEQDDLVLLLMTAKGYENAFRALLEDHRSNMGKPCDYHFYPPFITLVYFSFEIYLKILYAINFADFKNNSLTFGLYMTHDLYDLYESLPQEELCKIGLEKDEVDWLKNEGNASILNRYFFHLKNEENIETNLCIIKSLSNKLKNFCEKRLKEGGIESIKKCPTIELIDREI